MFPAALGMFNWANMIGWSNVASPQLRGNVSGFDMDDDGSSWVGSTIAFGGIFGSVFAGLGSLIKDVTHIFNPYLARQ